MTDYSHCSICGNPLKRDEFEICNKCANKFGITTELESEKIVNHKEKKGLKRYKGGVHIARRKP